MASERYQPFPNTHWSLVHRAGHGTESARMEALKILLARYEPALFSYLSSVRRMSAEESKEILQGFIADRILEAQLLQHVQAHRGKFRSFLLTCLRNYSVGRHRKEMRHAYKEF